MAALNKAYETAAGHVTVIRMEDSLAAEKLFQDLISRLRSLGINKNRPVVLMCIGTDRSTGDCLGPLVGTRLMESGQTFYNVYGCLEHPVHATNLEEKLKEVYTLYPDPFIIAVDACLGRIESVGTINVGYGSLQPGAGVRKSLPPVGDIHITGIVNVGGFMEYMVLQSTRLNTVMRLADIIVEGLLSAAAEYENRETRGI